MHLVGLQEGLHLWWRESLLADGRSQIGWVQGHISVLRLARRFWPLHLPRVPGQGVLRTAASPGILIPVVGFAILASVAARGSGGAGWILALLVLSAAVTAIAQQTLP
jgi:hypothetical protein